MYISVIKMKMLPVGNFLHLDLWRYIAHCSSWSLETDGHILCGSASEREYSSIHFAAPLSHLCDLATKGVLDI
jgi:hypothetical protein